MIKTKILIFLTLFVLQFFQHISAQKVWTLQECIDYALENNIRVKREKLKTVRKDNDLKQTKWNLSPDLNAGYVHSYKTGFSINDINAVYDNESKHFGYMGLESEVTIFNGMGNLNRVLKAGLELEKTLSEYHEFRNDMILSVAAAYLEILMNKEILEVAKSQLDLTTQQVDKTRQLVDVGNLAKGELLKIQALSANDKLGVVQSQNKLDISYLNLIQLLELDSVSGFEVFIPSFSDVASYTVNNVETVYQMALLNLPQIKSSELAVESSNKAVKIAKSKAYPEVKFRTELSSFYLNTPDGDSVQFYNQLNDYKSMVYFVDVSIPIFNKFQVNRDISNARLDLLDAEYNLELTKKEIYKSIQQTYADAIAAYNKYITAQEAVQSNEEAFKYTQQKYNVGLVTSVDYNLSKNDLLKARAELVISKYEFIFMVKILDFFSGKPFTI